MQIIMVHVGGKGTTAQGQELQLGVLGRLLAPDRRSIPPAVCGLLQSSLTGPAL